MELAADCKECLPDLPPCCGHAHLCAAQAARSAAQEERRASGRAAGPSGAPAAQGHALAYHAPPGLAGALEAHLQELADEVAVARLQARARVVVRPFHDLCQHPYAHFHLVSPTDQGCSLCKLATVLF